MATSSTLTIWMNGIRVGTWSIRRGLHVLDYDPAWIESEAGRPLSLSLPFTPRNEPIRGAKVEHYFDNLLPDSASIRSRIRAKFATDSTDAFDLLEEIGRDCVGAVQLLPEGEAPTGFDRIEAEPLSDRRVEELIAGSLSPARVLGQEDESNFRISLAGAQEKTALLFHLGRWCRPLGATPHAYFETAAWAHRSSANGHAGLGGERMAVLPAYAALESEHCALRDSGIRETKGAGG